MSDALSREQVKLWTVGEINAECAACRWVAESDYMAFYAQLEASEHAAYDVAGTIEALKANLEAMTRERDVAENERIEWVQRGERAEEAWAEANTAAIIDRADRMTAQARVAELERQLTTMTARDE